MGHVETSLTINAPPSVVWQCFMDKAAWHTFSAFKDLSPGTPIEEGRPFWFAIKMLGLPPPPLRVVVQRCAPEREVRWVGGLPFLPLFVGDHYFKFEQTPEGRTHLVHGEYFSGVAAGLFMTLLGDTIREIYHAFNAGLAGKAEQLHRRSQPAT